MFASIDKNAHSAPRVIDAGAADSLNRGGGLMGSPAVDMRHAAADSEGDSAETPAVT